MKHFLSLRNVFVGLLILGGLISLSLDFSPNPTPVPPAKTEWVNAQLSGMTLEEKIGQFFMVAAYSNRDERHFKAIDSLISNQKIGGLIFFQGERSNLTTAIRRFQKTSKIPLLIGMDAEWGTQMRLFGEDRFPYNYTIGAANDTKLTEEIARMIGEECREMGIHINFAPVADVNSNPDNPVIGFRSFGENPVRVGAHVAATVKGMESQGVLTSMKHFPGHGDTDTDSHLELPTVTNSLAHIDAIDFSPFRAGINAGASSVMIGHLNVPAIDSTGTPSSLSAVTIQEYLQKGMGFKGLVISDALNMKAVADRYGKAEVSVKAFQAGCDILLFPENVKDAITAISKKVKSGEISELEINNRCRKVLNAKYAAIIAPPAVKVSSPEQKELTRKLLYEKAITVLKNNDFFPIKRFDERIAHVSIGASAYPMRKSMDLVAPVDQYYFYTVEEALERLGDSLKNYDRIVTSIHSTTVRARNDYGFPKDWQRWLKKVAGKKNALIVLGNPLALQHVDLTSVQAVVIGYENHPMMLDRMGQFIMGTFNSSGTLSSKVNNEFTREFGIEVPWGGRLKESQPEELGISREKLKEIDRIAQSGIDAQAYPGCQIVVAVEGKVIWRKSYGYHTYDHQQVVKNEDVYDIASITKIAASTSALMRLETQDKFTLDAQLKTYLPELTGNNEYGAIKLRDMLTHQSGLVSWIPFYKSTLENNQPTPRLYVSEMQADFKNQVTGNLWMRTDYQDTILRRILETPLKARSYKYSDLGYYFVREIVKGKSGKPLDQFAMDELYKPMGLRYMRYRPLDYFPLSQIPPTEMDNSFRKQLVHGYVHDPGAAMVGGVGGHAGLFSNAGDLASLMQLFLNKGNYGGEQFLKSSVVEQYTACQYCPSNRRGAGFDKPTTNRKGGPTCGLASLASFGHTGFTGTMAWADPENQINYVFLSNRVYPDAENWKIVSMNIRTDIQQVIYEAVRSAK